MPLLAARSSCGPFPSPMAEGDLEIEMTEMSPQADAADGDVEMEMKDTGQETDVGSDAASDAASEGHEDDIRSGGNAEPFKGMLLFA